MAYVHADPTLAPGETLLAVKGTSHVGLHPKGTLNSQSGHRLTCNPCRLLECQGSARIAHKNGLVRLIEARREHQSLVASRALLVPRGRLFV